MILFDKLLNRFGLLRKTRVNELFPMRASISDKYGQPVPENYNNYLNAYNSEVWVYACVYVIANTIAGMPYRIYKKKIVNGVVEKVPVLNTPIHKLFEKPNKNDENSTWYNILEWTVANLELVGNAYWLLDRILPSSRLPLEIQMLLADRMRVVPGRIVTDPFITGYRYVKDDASVHTFTTDEITHFKYMSANNLYYGQGSLSAGRYSVDTFKEAQVSNLNIYRNGVNVDCALETEKLLNDKQFKRLLDGFLNKHQGSEKFHTPLVLEGGLKYKNTIGTMKELEFIAGLKMTREDICAVFGVPPVLVGILDNATYSNYREAEKIFLIFNIIPKLRRIQEVIETVVQRFDPSLYYEFDTANEEALKADEEIRSRIATSYFNMGVPFNTINERLNLGFPKIDGGDVGYLTFSLAPVARINEPPPEPSAPEPAAEPEDDKGVKLKTIYTKERKILLAKQFEDFIEKIDARYQGIIETFFLGLEMSIIRNLNALKSYEKAVNIDEFLYNEDEVIKRWQDKNSRVHKAALATNGQVQLDNMGVSVMFDVTNPFVSQFIEKFSLEKATEVIGSNREISSHVNTNIR